MSLTSYFKMQNRMLEIKSRVDGRMVLMIYDRSHCHKEVCALADFFLREFMSSMLRLMHLSFMEGKDVKIYLFDGIFN